MVMNLTVDYPELTDSAIAEARKLIGVPLRRYPSFTEASRGSIMNWARSIGDRNPLYMDDYHGRLSRYGGLIAPPLWLYAIDDTIVSPKLPGIHCIYGAVDWEFFKIVRMGDTFTTEVCVADVIEKQSKFCGRMVVQVGEVKYYNQKKELVAKASPKILRTATQGCPGKRTSTAEIQKHRYTREELAALEDGVDAEKWQGASHPVLGRRPGRRIADPDRKGPALQRRRETFHSKHQSGQIVPAFYAVPGTASVVCF
jgi:acyl dehydratase